MATKTWDPKQLVVVFAGQVISGFGENLVKADRAEDTFKVHVGADGEVCRSRSRNRSGTVEITLKSSSASNDVLASYAAIDELNGGGVAPLLIKDLSGTTLVMASDAWVKRPAPLERAKEAGDTTWIVETGELLVWNGGITPR